MVSGTDPIPLLVCPSSPINVLYLKAEKKKLVELRNLGKGQIPGFLSSPDVGICSKEDVSDVAPTVYSTTYIWPCEL